MHLYSPFSLLAILGRKYLPLRGAFIKSLPTAKLRNPLLTVMMRGRALGRRWVEGKQDVLMGILPMAVGGGDGSVHLQG